jgi:hypothetical protein
MILPIAGSSEAVIGTKLLSPTPYVQAMRATKPSKPRLVAFNWMANGALAASSDKSRSAQKRYRVISGQGTWICSPAGFGQRSRCYAG